MWGMGDWEMGGVVKDDLVEIILFGFTPAKVRGAFRNNRSICGSYI